MIEFERNQQDDHWSEPGVLLKSVGKTAAMSQAQDVSHVLSSDGILWKSKRSLAF